MLTFHATKTCHRLRKLSFDPILHAQRLQTASHRLSQTLPHRPSLSSLLPPQSTIYLSTTHVLARHLSRQLVSIRLNRNLSRRPSATSLVKSNILPEECCKCDKITGEVVWGGRVAPGLVGVKRKIEKEKVKDGLRAWLERKAAKMKAEEGKSESAPETEMLSVRKLIQKFTTSRKSSSDGTLSRWGVRWDSRASNEPTRAHVYGLRRFWEGLAKGHP